MAAPDLSNEGVRATLGKVDANAPGSHGGVPLGNGTLEDAPQHGSSGNPGVDFPWDGVDSTQIGFDTALPPLKNL